MTRRNLASTFVLTIVVALTITSTGFAQGPGFRGGRGMDSEFVKDRDTFHFLLQHHQAIRREVKELPNGVETVTETDDPQLVAKLQEHVAAMYSRLENNRPVRMRDPLFAAIFRQADKVSMKLDKTPKGIRVVETSDDPVTVRLIQAHAKVVSAFVARGFDEAHQMHPVPDDPGQLPDSAPTDASHHAHELDPTITTFAAFDRVYIPALARTNQGDATAARQALTKFAQQWDERFMPQLRSWFPKDDEWARELSGIAQGIAAARVHLEGNQLGKAHESLEPIRDSLLLARRRHQISYPLDHLSQFHATMEAIVQPAMQVEVPLSAEFIDNLRRLATQADAEWKVVEETSFDAELFQLDEAEQSRVASCKSEERAAIHELVEALGGDDHQALLMAARKLKPPFAKLYMTFGE